MGVLNLYDTDFYAWTQEQTNLLNKGYLNKIDVEHLIEELNLMGAREKSELKNRLAQLIMHLLKWKYQPNLQCRSWQNSIDYQREELEDLLMDNPSLKSKIGEYFPKSYKKAVVGAINETGVADSVFPTDCEWTIEQILDNSFFPVSS